jgi:hypothetical protein
MVIVLAVLPLVLPFPFLGIASAAIFPEAYQRLLQCVDFNCQAAIDWYRLGWFLVFGPSLFVAVASILFGAIGFIRASRHAISQENINLFLGSVVSGVVWVCLLACIMWAFYYLSSITD